ncbi:universal stress protein [Gramella sp. BOM4]|nr:universal stress protein [Christiangramia bathymodioli]
MKTILVPVDFSKHSEYALEAAAGLAKKYNTDLVVAHMMGLPETHLTKDEKQEVFNAMYFLKLTRQKFEAFLDKDYLKGIKVTEAVKDHKVFSELPELAREYQAGLIVMGSHGASGMKEVFIGSNTEKVVRSSKTPVLVVKNQVKDLEFKKAIFATDFENESIGAFEKASEFFESFGVKLKLLYINVPEKFMSSREMEERAAKFTSELGWDQKEAKKRLDFYDDYTVERGVFNYCHREKVDIIAIPTHGRKGVAHFFFGSLGEDIANHSDIPVVTFRIQDN